MPLHKGTELLSLHTPPAPSLQHLCPTSFLPAPHHWLWTFLPSNFSCQQNFSRHCLREPVKAETSPALRCATQRCDQLYHLTAPSRKALLCPIPYQAPSPFNSFMTKHVLCVAFYKRLANIERELKHSAAPKKPWVLQKGIKNIKTRIL